MVNVLVVVDVFIIVNGAFIVNVVVLVIVVVVVNVIVIVIIVVIVNMVFVVNMIVVVIVTVFVNVCVVIIDGTDRHLPSELLISLISLFLFSSVSSWCFSISISFGIFIDFGCFPIGFIIFFNLLMHTAF